MATGLGAEVVYEGKARSETNAAAKGEASGNGRDVKVFILAINETVRAENEGISDAQIKELVAKEARRVSFHELGHIMKMYSGEAYDRFIDYAVKLYKAKYSEERFNKSVEELKAENRGMTDSEAREEIACDMIPDILKDEKRLESFVKYMERDRTRFGRFLNAVHELMGRVRTFFEGLGFKARTPEEDLIRDAYIEMRRAYNRSAAEYRGQKRNGTVAGTVLVDKFGGIRRTNGENDRKNVKFSSVGAKNGRNNFFDYSKNDFSKQIDDFMKSERLRSMTQDDSFLIGGTPDVLIKSGFNALPVTLNKTHVEHALNGTKDFGHEIYVEVLKQLPEAIKKPVIVMVSDMNPNRAVIVLKITAKNGKKIYAPIEIDGTGRSNGSVVNSNAITSIFGKTNVENKIANALVQESQGKMSVYYWNKKEATTLLQRAGVQFPSALPQDGFVHSIREKGSPVNAKLENVTNSLQFKHWFGNWQNPSQARRINSLLLNTDGTPKVWYHQTEQEFDTFDLERNTNSENDSETPKGIYLKSSSNDIGLKGKIQMQFYVSARNILTFDSRAEASTWYDKNIPDYREAREKVDALNEKYQKKYDEQESKCDEYYYNNYDAFVRGEILEEEFTQKAEEGLDKILGEWKKADAELRKECRNILNSYFESGSYDGIYIKHDEGSLGRMTDALIVFDKRNVKSATDNIGTFDRRYENSRYSTVDTTKQGEDYDRDKDKTYEKRSEKLRKLLEDDADKNNLPLFKQGWNIETSSGKKTVYASGTRSYLFLFNENQALEAAVSEDQAPNFIKRLVEKIDSSEKYSSFDSVKIDLAAVREAMHKNAAKDNTVRIGNTLFNGKFLKKIYDILGKNSTLFLSPDNKASSVIESEHGKAMLFPLYPGENNEGLDKYTDIAGISIANGKDTNKTNTATKAQEQSPELKKLREKYEGKEIFDGKDTYRITYSEERNAFLMPTVKSDGTLERGGATIVPSENPEEFLEDFAKWAEMRKQDVEKSKEKERIEAEKEALLKEKQAEKEKYLTSFLSGKSPMQAGKMRKTLIKYFTGGLNTHEFIEKAVRDGKEFKVEEENGKNSYWLCIGKHEGYIITKTAYDYGKFLEGSDEFNSAGEASAAENTSVNAVETSEEVVEQPEGTAETDESVAETDESVIEAPEETDEAEEAEEAEKTDTDAEEADRLTPEYNSKGQKVSAFAETVADVGMRLNEAGRTEEGADMVETANRIAENPAKNRTGVITHEKTAKLAEERMAKTDEGKTLQESIKEAVVRYDTALNGKDGIETLDTADTYAVLDYAKSAKELGMTDEYDALLAIAAENFTRAGRLVELAKVWAVMSGASHERYMKRHQKSFNKQLRKKLSKMKQAEFVHAQKFTHIRSNPMYLRAC